MTPPGTCPYCANGYVCPEVKHAGPAVIAGKPYFWLFDHGVLRLFPYPVEKVIHSEGP